MEPKLQAGTRVLVELGNGESIEGIISDVDIDAYPAEQTPYRVVTIDWTECIGWYGDDDFLAVFVEGSEVQA